MLGLRTLPALRASSRPMMRPMVQSLGLGLRTIGTIPEPPGGIVGTVNEPVKVPPPSRSHGSFHWSFERVVSAAVVPLAVLPFVTTLTPVVETTLTSLLIVHTHIGLSSCIIDYIPKRKYGSFQKVAYGALYAGTAAALYGLYEYETNDVGITEGIKKVWNA